MNRRTTPSELETLLTACMEGSCDAAQSQRIERLMEEDPASFDAYIEMMSMHAMLEWRHGIPAEAASEEHSAYNIQRSEVDKSQIPNQQLSSPPSSLFPGPLPAIILDTTDIAAPFVPAPLPLYVAHPFLFSNLFALLVMGLGLLGAWMYQVDIPRPIAHINRPAAIPVKPRAADDFEFVGQVTGMVDVQWADVQTATLHGANVPLGRKYALASGLMEITYKTGAKVILQGPVAYQVESRDGGFLSIGKVTARLEKRGEGSEESQEKQSAISGQQSASVASVANQKSEILNHKSLASSPQPLAPNANPQSPIPNPSLPPVPSPLFTIRTPTATVTDLGTEFGVEVTKDGRNRLHVFEGKVRLESRGSAVTASPKYELAAGESADVEPEGRVVRHSKGHADVVAQSVRFVRVLDQPQPLVAYWSMNEGQGKTAHDQSINHIDGWLNGPVTWTQGKFGSAIRVPGEGYVYCKSSPKLAFGKGDFTVALWFQAKDLTDWRWLLNYNGEGAGKDQAALVVTIHGTRLRVSLGEWFTDVTNNPTIDVNETDWYHIAVVRQRSLVQGYVNGRPDGSPVVSLANLPLGSMRLGQGPHGNAFEGALDDVALWNVALKPAQIKALAEGTATPLNVVEIDPPQKNKQ